MLLAKFDYEARFDAHRVNPVIPFACTGGIRLAVPKSLVRFPERGSPISPDAGALSPVATPPIGITLRASVNAALASRWSLCPQCAQANFFPAGLVNPWQREHSCEEYAAETSKTITPDKAALYTMYGRS
jgi:hypothetical protein